LYNNPSLYQATGYQRDVTADGNWSDSVWNANGQSGQTFANSSAVQLDAENSPTLTLNQNVTVNSLDFNGSMTIEGSNTITLNGEKRITVADADDVVTISAPISPLYDNTFTKAGAGTLVFTEANAYTGNPTVSDGTLRLTDNAVTANGVITLEADDTLGTKGTLEYNVASGEKTLIFSNAASVIGNGDILKTGEGRLKINTEQLTGDLHFTADNFVVASGRLDLEGYMLGNIEVDANTVFSPGNSIGEATFGGGYILKDGATLLLEVGKDGDDVLTDVLNVTGDTTFEDRSIIKIALDSSYDNNFVEGDQADIQLPSGILGSDGNDLNLDNLVLQLGMFELVGYDSGTGILSVRLSAPAAGVPEPSTWALLLLGAAGLLYVRKRNK
jgi:autotransporter-associated beta strand protein